MTIATDGSVSYDRTCASWACYILTPDNAVHFGGVLPVSVGYNPLVAEMMAVANALYRLEAMVADLSECDVIIYTDCLDVITVPRRIRGAHASKMEIVKSYQHILDKLGHYEFKWVRGHTELQTRPHVMNRWCDRYARRLLREAVEKSRQKKG
ncbi:RNase_H_like domain containing protein [uncultured Caudovirales phage]|uniref:RNase_H_like domain containing protein n=1 Tax=uncultured Caudovirales phage TaxID=2100421 RepID=A0A6J5N1Z6_9CAUD|nr:RNase_H_like domain containing protein [uncultured Caudovirales phage]